VNKVYEDGAKAAHRNSLDLLEEANILYNSSKYVRAYALCVLSSEEFVKAFLYKRISVGVITDPDFKNDIRSHKEKIYHVLHLFLGPSVLDSRYRDFLTTIEHDKLEKDHSKHLGEEAFKRLYAFWNDDKDNIIDKQQAIFRNADELKLKAIYVDMSKIE